MTEAERLAISNAIKRQRKAIKENPELARDALIRSGIYTTDGILKHEYGGPKKKSAA